MFTNFLYRDPAYWCAFSYAVGSGFFILAGTCALVATTWSEEIKEPRFEVQAVIAISIDIGMAWYQVGATAAMLEIINDPAPDAADMDIDQLAHEHGNTALEDEELQQVLERPVSYHQAHLHERAANSRHDSFDPEADRRLQARPSQSGSACFRCQERARRRGELDPGRAKSTRKTWRWCPTWHELWAHHVRNIVFVALSIQGLGVTVFGGTGVVLLMGVFHHFDAHEWDRYYFIPQMAASTCFIIANVLLTLKEHQKWYKPQFSARGWWVGVLAVIGSIGFL